MEVVQRTAFMAIWTLLVAGLVWMNVAIIRRRRRTLTAHPERRPYGWKLLLRASPFIAIVVISAVYGIVARDAFYAVVGVLGTAGFLWELSHRWRRPSA